MSKKSNFAIAIFDAFTTMKGFGLRFLALLSVNDHSLISPSFTLGSAATLLAPLGLQFLLERSRDSFMLSFYFAVAISNRAWTALPLQCAFSIYGLRFPSLSALSCRRLVGDTVSGCSPAAYSVDETSSGSPDGKFPPLSVLFKAHRYFNQDSPCLLPSLRASSRGSEANGPIVPARRTPLLGPSAGALHPYRRPPFLSPLPAVAFDRPPLPRRTAIAARPSAASSSYSCRCSTVRRFLGVQISLLDCPPLPRRTAIAARPSAAYSSIPALLDFCRGSLSMPAARCQVVSIPLSSHAFTPLVLFGLGSTLSLHQPCGSLLSPPPSPQPPTPASLVWVGVTFRSRGRSGSRCPGPEVHGLDCLGPQLLAVCYLLERLGHPWDRMLRIHLIAACTQPPASAWCTPVGDGAFSES